jgi:hypothetical protein
MTKSMVLCALAFFASGCVPPAIVSNVPSTRLENGIYTSPDNEFSVRIPDLFQPGTRINERQINPATWGVFFVDDFGRIYTVLKSEMFGRELTIEEIATDFEVGELLHEKEFIETARGRELRLAGLSEGGSPLISRTMVDGQWVVTRNDLIEAWSVFLHGSTMYTVTVGITPLNFAPEMMRDGVLVRRSGDDSAKPETEAIIKNAKQRLDIFLGTLSLRAP